MTTPPIRVTILDDHQGIIDGYLYRLSSAPGFEIAATLSYGEELEPTLEAHPTNVLLLDINVPTSAENPNPYPILHSIPSLLQKYPDLDILVISMFAERSLIQAVMEAGASGYILKDDQATIRDLANVVVSVANGGVYFSQKAHKLFLKNKHIDDSVPLSPRQLEALSLCAAYPDWTSADLAEKMSVSNSTVRNLLSGAYIRLGVHSRTAAIEKARQLGLITPHSPAPSI
ncbi:MAG: response regulator transcription factor [Anaerolineales bacterium]|nr:response regulator transcription factor [Anaerolineales bacterium]